MQVILNNGKETIDFTQVILKQMAGELTREQVQELINKARQESIHPNMSSMMHSL